jgi:hypothetical protein
MQNIADVQLGDVYHDFGSPFVAVAVVQEKMSLFTNHFLIGVPESGWRRSRFLQTCSKPKTAQRYMRDALVHEDCCCLSIIQLEIGEVVTSGMVNTGLDQSYLRAAREIMGVGSRLRFDGHKDTHTVEAQFLTFMDDKADICVVCATKDNAHPSEKVMSLSEAMRQSGIPLAGIKVPASSSVTRAALQ